MGGLDKMLHHIQEAKEYEQLSNSLQLYNYGLAIDDLLTLIQTNRDELSDIFVAKFRDVLEQHKVGDWWELD